MLRTLCPVVLVPLLAAGLALPARGQSNPLPDTYSFRATTSLMSPEMQVRVNRAGAWELVELNMPAKAGQGYELHQRLLYDFAGHRVFVTDLLSNRCTVQEYRSSYAPMFDPIGGSEQMIAEMAKDPPPVSRREVVNGIPTRLIEMPLAEGQGRSRIWLDEKYGFLVRMAVGMGTDSPSTRVEIRQLSYAPTPVTLFAPPAGCARIGGYATAEGGHAEMAVEAAAAGQTQLPEPPASGQVPQPAATEPASAPPPRAPTQVTSVRLRLVPERYRGPCPGKLQLVGEFTTDGPGTVWYEFMAGAVSSSPEGSLTFQTAGTKTVTVQGGFSTEPQVPEAGLLAAIQDEHGQHGADTVASEPVRYDIVCTSH